MNPIEVKNLKKSYGKIEAVRGVSFAVAEGEIFGLLGPNGAGKTTTLEILEGLKRADSGKIKVLGLDIEKNIHEIRQKVGIVLQSTGLLPDLTLAELFRLFASFYQNSRPLEE